MGSSETKSEIPRKLFQSQIFIPIQLGENVFEKLDTLKHPFRCYHLILNRTLVDFPTLKKDKKNGTGFMTKFKSAANLDGEHNHKI